MSYKKLFVLSATLFFTLALAAFAGGNSTPSGIMGTCDSGGTYVGTIGNCNPGTVTWTGTSGYPKHVELVIINNANGTTYEDQLISTTGGAFTWTSGFATVDIGSYTVTFYDPRGKGLGTVLETHDLTIAVQP